MAFNRRPTSHEQGKYHKNYKRIQALLKQNCISFAEIGRRIGVTREAVRITAKRLGIEGTSRKEACSIREIDHVLKEKQSEFIGRNALLGRFISACENRNLPVSCVLADGDGRYRGSRAVSSREVVVGDKRVYVRSAYLRVVKRSLNVQLGPPPTSTIARIDVVCTEVRAGMWLIMLVEKLPKKGTMFALSEPNHRVGRTLRSRHDYRAYLDNWSIFAEEESHP